MKALILNSGIGHRLGAETKSHPKCMTILKPEETILSRQLRQLEECGIDEIVMTTGYMDDVLRNYCCNIGNSKMTYVYNPDYETTNYIYSIFLAAPYLLDDDILLLHGDMVIEDDVLHGLLHQRNSSVCISSTILPNQKDFHAVLQNGYVRAIRVGTEAGAVASFPAYFIKKEAWKIWLDAIYEFCKDEGGNRRNVYAEEAFNEVSGKCKMLGFEVQDRICMEIDDMHDLRACRTMLAKKALSDFVNHSRSKVLLICSEHIKRRVFDEYCFSKDEELKTVWFCDFSSNPDMKSALTARDIYCNYGCDSIASVGGGSAIDVGKATKYFLNQKDVPLLAFPTTAGTGAEVTPFAVLYKGNRKQSVESETIIPTEVIYDSDVVIEVPSYQKKAAFMDLICHGIETYWSVKRTIVSTSYARKAIMTAIPIAEDYLAGDYMATAKVQEAAYYAGKAISISYTAAGHAMSYGLTKKYNIAHGHAAAICDVILWDWMIEQCNKDEENVSLRKRLEELSAVLGKETMEAGADMFKRMVDNFGLYAPVIKNEDLEELTGKVNEERLSNHMLKLSRGDVFSLYKQIQLWGTVLG